MIRYVTGFWGLGFIWRRRGSVFHKAFLWALTSCILTVIYNRMIHARVMVAPSFLTNDHVVAPITLAFSLFTGVLSFLLVFRNQEAYKIWIEAGVLLKTVRSSWFNAYSSLIAFRTRDESRLGEVQEFQNFLMRLMSLLYCTALQQVLDHEKDSLEVIDLQGIDHAHLEFLCESEDRAEVIHQWVQRLIVHAEDDRVVQISPPILGRVYNDLAAGMVALQKARRISEFYFPFPYAQMLTVLLLVTTFVQPAIVGTFIVSPFWAGILVFIGVFTLWSISYVAQEIERPFGDSANDLPLVDMQLSFNRSLTAMLEKNALTPPQFSFAQAKNQTVPVTDGINALEEVVPVEGTLPVLRKDTRALTRAYSPAHPQRCDSLVAPSRETTIPARSDTRSGTRLEFSSGEGRSIKRAAALASASEAEDEDVEAGLPGELTVAMGAKTPRLIRKIGPPRRKITSISAKPSESTLMSI